MADTSNPDIQPEVPTGKAAGGKARWANRSEEERKQASKRMVEARVKKAKLPVAAYSGTLKVGDIEIGCHVLDNGMQILSERAVSKALGAKRGGSHWKRLKKAQEALDAGIDDEDSTITLPVLSAANIAPFVDQELAEGLRNTIEFRTAEGLSDGRGIEARLLPMVLNTLLKVRDAGAEHPSQRDIITQADILMRGFALVGITALIDEATGYTRNKEKEALARIMEAFVAKEMQPWVRTFPADYYESLCRLYGLPFPPKSGKWPQFFGAMTNNLVYSRLAPGLLPELKKAAAGAERKARLHQMLTTDVGHPKLKEHLAVTTAMMKIAKDKDQLLQLMDQVAPKWNSTLQLPLDEPNP